MNIFIFEYENQYGSGCVVVLAPSLKKAQAIVQGLVEERFDYWSWDDKIEAEYLQTEIDKWHFKHEMISGELPKNGAETELIHYSLYQD